MTGRNRLPVGKFLDDLPKAVYVVTHVLFLGIGVWLWARARGNDLPYSEALLLYSISQIVFFGYFANLITMKMAVLAEQTLMIVMVLWIILQAA
ncbi:MAG: hypothetical protein EXR53_04375 [Dehalococcoidia bacterium]|nr:hypothetical protein [Dehalococcoidia bacterium]